MLLGKSLNGRSFKFGDEAILAVFSDRNIRTEFLDRR